LNVLFLKAARWQLVGELFQTVSMKQFSKLLVFAGITVFSLAACKRDDDAPSTPRYASLAETRAMLERPAISTTVDGTNGGSYFIGRCRVIVPANAFQTAGGTPVTGNVTLQFRDLIRRGEMIFARVLPVSNGQQLVSGGEVWIVAQQNGSELRLRPGARLDVRIPQNGQPTAGLTFFAGDRIDSVADGANTINWRQRRDPGQGQTGPGIVINGDTVNLMTDSLGWCNADRFLSNPNYQTFTVTLSGASGFDNGQILGYASYDNFPGAWPLNGRSGNVYSENHVPDVPVHFVVYGVKDGRFYGGITAATPANGGNYTVSLSETTVAAFKAQVDAL
jgi:hypothetical protein